MFTLPVQPWKHIVSKMVVSALWMVASVIVTMITVFIMALDWEDLRMFAEIPRALAVLYQQMGVHGYLYILEFCTLCAAGLAMGILNIYFSISVGQLFKEALDHYEEGQDEDREDQNSIDGRRGSQRHAESQVGVALRADGHEKAVDDRQQHQRAVERQEDARRGLGFIF